MPSEFRIVGGASDASASRLPDAVQERVERARRTEIGARFMGKLPEGVSNQNTG
jgi:hypothetical protein